MRRVLTTLMTVGLITVVPGLVGKAYAHGGQYRGPAGEVPPDSREPSDPPPPAAPPPRVAARLRRPAVAAIPPRPPAPAAPAV